MLVSAISPYRDARQAARSRIGSFVEVFVNAPLEVCEERDPKGFYRAAREGRIQNATGITAPFESPVAPEIECRTDLECVDESVAKVLRALEELGYALPLSLIGEV